MEYNSQRDKMMIPEYGRNIQKMTEYCLTIEDREKRTRTAEFIVNVMAQMVPKVRETSDYWQKLWDHLHIISGFRLDVDGPYPAPSKDILTAKPRKLRYSVGNIKFRHYGKNIENIINKAILMDDGEEKDILIKTIANHMKKSYLNWNRASVDDDLILNHLNTLSNNRLKLNEDHKLSQTSEILARNKKKKIIRPGAGGNGNFKPRRSNNMGNRQQ
jgi:hypothetical protein